MGTIRNGIPRSDMMRIPLPEKTLHDMFSNTSKDLAKIDISEVVDYILSSTKESKHNSVLGIIKDHPVEIKDIIFNDMSLMYRDNINRVHKLLLSIRDTDDGKFLCFRMIDVDLSEINMGVIDVYGMVKMDNDVNVMGKPGLLFLPNKHTESKLISISEVIEITGEAFKSSGRFGDYEKTILQGIMQITLVYTTLYYMTIFFTTVTNIKYIDKQPLREKKISRRKIEKMREFNDHRIITLSKTKTVYEKGDEHSHTGGKQRLHICRGHFKVYTEEAPLMGKCVGRYWFPTCLKGDAKIGVVPEKEITHRVSTEN